MIQIMIDDNGVNGMELRWKSKTERARLYFILPLIRKHLNKLDNAIVKDSMKMVLISALRNKEIQSSKRKALDCLI
jgi:hypothetical protein